MSFTRSDRSLLSEWWFTVDRALLAIFLVMMGAGVILSLAASPSVAVRKGFATYHFAVRHFGFAALGVLVMLAVSMFSPRQIRRLALLTLAAALVLLVWVVVAGPEINGARRWLRFAGLSFQPSELAKPGFVVISAWLLAESRRVDQVPALGTAIGLLALVSALLLLQPDVGQTMLLLAIWGTLLFLAGHSVILAGLFASGSLVGLGLAYMTFDYVRRRVDRFLDPSSGDNYQIEKALQSFNEGGFLGRGPGEGSIKTVLPDAHTDFIFAVIGEELGAVACLVLIALFAVVGVRAFRRAAVEGEQSISLAIAGLATMMCLQAMINMSVNVGLLPAKGMTLPFISTGGSSTLSAALSAGFLLALMRRRPEGATAKMPQLRSMYETA
ncbi:MAG: putative peptidoglycan glycosyltransferase FtsW [Hyphomicrobiaceae bacterium]